MKSPIWLAAGTLALILGVIGIALPLLPTTPFVLLAAYCFARGNPRWAAWLQAHPRFGPMVREWQTHHAVPRRAKWLAWSMMAISCGLTAWLVRWPWGLLPLPVCLTVGVWLATLPDAREASDPPY